MKKLLLSFILFLFISGTGFSQNYDLEFDYSVNGTATDTLVLGKSYGFEAIMYNNGPGDFSDMLDFRFYIGTSSSGFNPAITKEFFKINNPKFLSIPIYGTESYHGQFDVSPLYFKENSYNIVIIWPTDSYHDQNNKNDYKILKFFVKSSEVKPENKLFVKKNNIQNEYQSSLNTIEGTSKLSFYPNPASNILNVYVKVAESGTLKITDINGKLIQQAVIGTDQRQSFVPFQLTKDGTALPNGIYLISLETGNYCEVKKFVVFK